MKSQRIRVYSDADFVGFLTLNDDNAEGVAAVYTRRDFATTTLYRLRDGRFVAHIWDYDDPSISRTAQLLAPSDAAEWLERNDLDVPSELESHLGPDLLVVKTTTKPQNKSEGKSGPVAGFHGIRELMKVFDQPHDRREAVKKRLERLRSRHLDGTNLWIEQAEPRSRTPRFLYNASDPRVQDAVTRK